MDKMRLHTCCLYLALFACACLLSVAVAGQRKEINQTIRVNNTAQYIGDGDYKWMVYIEADDATLRSIKYVEYTLHPTFPKPKQQIQTIGNRRFPFALNASGWGEFNIRVKIVYKDKRESTYLDHRLKLFQ